jgi:hypothetical protein
MKRNLAMTYDPDSKEKTEPRILLLDPATPLRLGEKPLKNDGDASSRSSSPMPPGTPSTPAKGVQPVSEVRERLAGTYLSSLPHIYFTLTSDSVQSLPTSNTYF